MKQTRPIILIDDDDEDLQLIKEAFKELDVDNVVSFDDGHKALEFLREATMQPYFILCDVNMSRFDGFDLREEIHKDEELRIKSIPFLFLSTSGTRPDIKKAYNLSVQGYFKKPQTFDGIVNMLRCIIDYWSYCNHPNSELIV